jgi:hypothetical protein
MESKGGRRQVKLPRSESKRGRREVKPPRREIKLPGRKT